MMFQELKSFMSLLHHAEASEKTIPFFDL